jgi:hypothetical protein
MITSLCWSVGWGFHRGKRTPMLRRNAFYRGIRSDLVIRYIGGGKGVVVDAGPDSLLQQGERVTLTSPDAYAELNRADVRAAQRRKVIIG